MTKEQYKEYFEQNNFKGNNHETAKFIKFLMDKRVKGQEMEELTGIKHSQITSYKKIIRSGKMDDLKNISLNKVFKSIGRLDESVISEIENIPDKFLLGEDSDDELYELFGDDDYQIAWEEEVKRLALKKSNGITDDAEYLITELVDENRVLRRKITQDGGTIKEIREENERLRRENASLLAYKNFFRKLGGSVRASPSRRTVA